MDLVKRAKHDLKLITSTLFPPSSLTVSEWADTNRYLRTTTSAEPGRWRTDRFPFNREILDSLSTSSPVKEVVHMKAAQVGATDGATCWLGYIIDQEPGPAMAVQPTVDLAKRFSRQRVGPMTEDAPCLKGKIKESRSRDSGNTILSKEFPGGILLLAGANSAAALRSASIRYLFLDELDAYPADVEGEGDPADLAIARTRNFTRRKIYKASTPTISGISRIEADYLDSDQRKYFIPCPDCDHMHELQWQNFIIPKNEKGEGLPQKAHMVCPACGVIIKEHHKTRMLERGQWRPTNPDYPDKTKHGYHVSALYSPLGFFSWTDCASQWIKAQKDTNKLKTFVNTVLGECWVEDEGESIEAGEVSSRREFYGTHAKGSLNVPSDVLILTAAVDVQDTWLEYEVVGWGNKKRSWGIETRRIMGDLTKQEIWHELDLILQRTWTGADGRSYRILCTCIDSGGHFAQEVYNFVKGKEHRRVFAIKGRGGLGVPLVGKHTRSNRARVALFPVGDDTGKETVLNRLKITDPDDEGYCSFPSDPGFGYDDEYFEGLTSEKRRIKYTMGKARIEWVKKSGARNEPLDIRKYATAALEILNPNLEILAEAAKKDKSILPKYQKKRRVLSSGV